MNNLMGEHLHWFNSDYLLAIQNMLAEIEESSTYAKIYVKVREVFFDEVLSSNNLLSTFVAGISINVTA